MTDIPAEVTIGPHRWRILSDAETCESVRDTGDRGRTHADRHVILVDANRPPSGVAETVLHEIHHAILDTAGIEADPRFDRGFLEAVVTLTAPLLLDTIRRNPDLIRYLKEAT